MAISIHVARHGLWRISDVSGKKYRSTNSAGVSFKEAMKFHTDDLVEIDSAINSTAGNPTVKAYLEAEAAVGYSFKHLDESYIITEKTS